MNNYDDKDLIKSTTLESDLYRQVTIGTAANVYHCHQAARTLRAAGQHPKNGLQIRNPEKLRNYAQIGGLAANDDINNLAVDFANWIIADICRPRHEPSQMVAAFAPKKRKTLWRKMGLFPGGANDEVTFVQTNCMTNLNADPVDFLLTGVRLGIINEYNGLYALAILQEIMYGPQKQDIKKNLPGGSWQPLIDQIVSGNIRGIITILSCTNASYGQGGNNIFRIAEGLIKENILVLSGGCTSNVMEYTGLCHLTAAEEAGDGLKKVCQSLGIPPVLSYGASVDIGKMAQTAIEIADTLNLDTNQLPLVISAPEYMKQKAIADACTAIAFGWMVHVAPVPSVTGSEMVVKTLAETTEELGFGKLMVEQNAGKAVQIYRNHIEKKRAALGLS